MWFLFKKHRNEQMGIVENSRYGFTIVNKFYLFAQDKWAKKMEVITSRLSKRCLIFLFGGFVIITVGECIYIILKSFSNTDNGSIKIVPISKPTDMMGKSLASESGGLPVSKKGFE